MLIIVDKNLEDIIPSNRRKLRKVLKDLRENDPDIYHCIEDDIRNNFSCCPDEDEASDYFLENYPHIFAQYNSEYIPDELCAEEEEN